MNNILKILICMFVFNACYAKEKSEREMFMDSIKLMSELLAKLEADTPFTIADDAYFFGEQPPPGEWRYFFYHSDYITEEEFEKNPPKYSFYGELLRLNRDKILGGVKYKIFYCSSGRYIDKKGEWHDTTLINPTVFVVTNVNIVSMNSIYGDYLAPVIYVNGVHILKELGYLDPERQHVFNKETVDMLKKHVKELEKMNLEK